MGFTGSQSWEGSLCSMRLTPYLVPESPTMALPSLTCLQLLGTRSLSELICDLPPVTPLL